jgi:transcriptional regulator with XRE-family HTH domain
MKHFGALAKRLRGSATLREIERRTGLSHSYLSKIERGAKVPSEERARQVLGQGFGLDDREIERALIEVSLEDRGLEEAELRHLVADLIQGNLPRTVLRRILLLYRSRAVGRKTRGSHFPR